MNAKFNLQKQANPSAPRQIAKVAIPAPLGQLFDYLLPKPSHHPPPKAGQRVKVPFGRQTKTGILISIADHSEYSDQQLKSIETILDPTPLLKNQDLQLLKWVSDYYHHPLGNVCATALPTLLRQGNPPKTDEPEWLRLTPAGQTAFEQDRASAAPRQTALLRQLAAHENGCAIDQLKQLEWNWRPPLNKLLDKQWVEWADLPAWTSSSPFLTDIEPNAEQQSAITLLAQKTPHFQTTLLEGVTGSGKTEVYLRCIEQALAQRLQALVLLPEISLTPQLAERFKQRLAAPIALFHSGLTDHQRLSAWQQAQSGRARIILGTRSAVFTPMPELGLIILDEEHDASFKQQEGLRYSARDVAIMRAKINNIPVLLGSATPSFESLHNAKQQRYQHAFLRQRAGGAKPPSMQLIDCRQQSMPEGISKPLLEAIQQHLSQQQQVLLFLNQRGFAPTLMCHACGWVASCRRCDSRMVIHQSQGRMKCHHCGTERQIPQRCGECNREELFPLGQGTQRIEAVLEQQFPTTPILRIDRDSTRRKGALEQTIETIHEGQPHILVGTQMLAKGHHFPKVTLVGILDVDGGLFSCDFRASERMAQLIMQVAGRAGRAEQPGRVLLQTHQPDHPLLVKLLSEGYAAFAEQALQERLQAQLPPYSYQALIRAEASAENTALTFLQQVRQQLSATASLVEILGPVPAPMLKRTGRYRYQLLLQSLQRKPLHQLLSAQGPALAQLPMARRVRWSLDIDPLDLF